MSSIFAFLLSSVYLCFVVIHIILLCYRTWNTLSLRALSTATNACIVNAVAYVIEKVILY